MEKGGLNQAEAKQRLAQYGFNKLPDAKVDGIGIIFLRQFQSPLIYILFLSSLAIFWLKELIDGAIILFVLVFNAAIGTFQEGKAQNTLLALKKMTQTNANVVRDGTEVVIPDYEVVPGDLLILQEGDKIPADAKIIVSSGLQVDEAILTGESMPVYKDVEQNIFKGTHIVSGSGKAIVTATGVHTEMGKISREVVSVQGEMPLKTNIKLLTKMVIMVVASISTGIFLLGIFLGNEIKEMFAVVVSIAVSAIPEGLPIVLTLVLSTGVWRMSKRSALVKKLQAVEALGQANVIAVDKTGTITKNEIVLSQVYVGGKFFDVESDANFKKTDPAILLAGKIAAYGTNGILSHDPSEAAISNFARKIGFKQEELEKKSPRLSEVPFDYKLKFHTVSRKIDREHFTTIIGAPEVLLESANLTKNKKDELGEVFIKMSGKGLRVFAFGTKNASSTTFVGFYGLRDSLRPEIRQAVQVAKDAGVKVVMITGDHKVTAEAIAKEAGIFLPGDSILTGEELKILSKTELLSVLPNTSVFARVTPEDKLKIVQAYQSIGKVIAMTGDGVNDAPSLVAANLGVAMGKIGTEVAKEAADIVLLDDNFASITAAIEEGRSIYVTIRKVILYLFSTGLGEILVIVGALLLGLPLPLLAAQIIWLNLVTDSFLDVSLAMEPKEEGLLDGKFVQYNKYLLDLTSGIRIVVMAIPMMIGSLYLFNLYQYDLIKAQTVTVCVLAVFQWFNAWNCRHRTKSLLNLNPFGNKYLIAATCIVVSLQILAVYTPFMQGILRTTPLELADWLLIIPVASTVIVVEEIRKFIYRKLRLG